MSSMPQAAFEGRLGQDGVFRQIFMYIVTSEGEGEGRGEGWGPA
jgi:hypothetical protein